MQDHASLGAFQAAELPSERIPEPSSYDWTHARRLFDELVAGRSAVSMTYQHDGRSYLVLTPARGRRHRRPLTARELEVTRLMAAGLTDKEIGGRLGIAVSSVATHRNRAQRKLGIASRAMLTQLIHLLETEGQGAAAPSSFPDPLGAPITVKLPDWSKRMPPRLTRAERNVALLLLDGMSNSEISHRRGTSERTVANQVAAIGRKTGVSGRRALAAALIRECLTGFVPPGRG